MKAIRDIFTNEKIFLPLIILVFLLVRLPGVHLPLHQDEYKWPLITSPGYVSDVSIPHPPLSELIYKTSGYIVGFNVNFRFVPLFFGTLNLFLLYYFVRENFGKKEGILASLIWSLAYFSILASLMVDTDGEILPFFFLLSLIGYTKLLNTEGQQKYKWGILLIISSLFGLLVKISFVLAVGAILADFLWSRRNYLSKKDVLKYLSWLASAIIVFILILFLSQKIFPFFHLSASLSYWEHFATLNKGWLQTFIQCVKAFLYSSPFLVFISLFIKKEDLPKLRVFIFFLIFAFIFYVVLFDFSTGALDRYLQLLVLPLSVMNAVSLAQFKKLNKKFFIFASLLSILFFALEFINHYVPPLNPKTEWISRILSLKWNFLYPFSGGSGPLGFYVSFLFMASVWLVSLFATGWGLVSSKHRLLAVSFLIPLGIIYNGVFMEEYLFGLINGSAPKLLHHAVEFMKNNPKVDMVTTYNDNGGFDIQQIGKYRKRLYIDPKFDNDPIAFADKIANLNKYKEDYFVLDVPRFDQNTIYARYFNSCQIIYNETDKAMSAKIYDCHNAPNIK